MMRAGLDVFHAIECFVVVPFFQAQLAAAELAAGRTAEAQEAVDVGLRLVERTGERAWDAELWRVQAAILAHAPGARADGLTASGARSRARQAAELSGAVALHGAHRLRRVEDGRIACAQGARAERRGHAVPPVLLVDPSKDVQAARARGARAARSRSRSRCIAPTASDWRRRSAAGPRTPTRPRRRSRRRRSATWPRARR